MWIAPAARDAGGAVGAALAACHHYFGQPRVVDSTADGMSGCYLGPEFSDEEIEEFLREQGCAYTRQIGRA